MEARVGIEPTIEDLQSSALPLGDRAYDYRVRSQLNKIKCNLTLKLEIIEGANSLTDRIFAL